MKDLIALFDNHKIYDTDIWTNVLILLVFTDLYLGVCCPQKEPGITFQDLTLINLIPFVILGIVCIWTVKFFTCILFALCTLAVPLIGNYIFLFNNEEVSIFTLKEYAMKTNNTVIAQIVSDIEIQKSRKVKSARRTRNLSGEYTASFVCYGYKKDPDDKHKLIIDEEAAKVVVEIFSLIIAGYNASEVARILNERKIPTRVQNQWKNGINYVPVHNKGDYMWDNSEVIAIVQNEQYKGIMIQNKCETVGFGDNKKVRKRNKEDWSVVEGAIPRIVSDEMFDEVNKMLRVEARGIEKSTKKRKKNLFICPYCGRKLMNSSAVCTPKLLCPKRRMVRTGECQQIFMLKSEAQDKVLEITKEICRTLIQEEELKKASKDKRKVTSDEYLISELKAEYDRISNSTVSCYQSYREGKYTKEEYVQLRKTNQELLADLENQISDLQEKVANQEPDAEEKIEQLTQYSMLEQYDGDVLSNIIDKVLIYNDKDIEVVFKGENFIRNAV